MSSVFCQCLGTLYAAGVAVATESSFTVSAPFLYRSKTGELFMLWSSARRGYLQIASRSASGKLRGPWTVD